MGTKELGDLGERIACEYLVKKGYKILAKNYRISFGEIDIIAKKRWNFGNLFKKSSSTGSEQAIHFIEVKTIVLRQAQDDFFPEEKVNYKKQRRLIGLCQIWLEKNKFPEDYPYQIDVIGILVDPYSNRNEINYFPNVVEDLN